MTNRFKGFSTDSDPSQVRQYDAADGSLTLVGHCFASEEEMAAAIRQANDTGDVLPLTSMAGGYSGILETPEFATVFSDLSGQFPMYYRHTKEGWAISDSSYHLTTRGSKEIDRTSLAVYLGFHAEFLLNEGYSMFEGVKRLPPANNLRIDNSGIKQGVYDTLEPREGVTFAMAAEQTRSSLISAIQPRLDTPTLTSHLSGGQDSTSLAMLAAELGDSPLPSFVDYSEQWPAGDIDYARHLATLHPRIDLREVVTTEADLPYSNMSLPFTADEPFKGGQTLAQDLCSLRAIRASGSTLHLTGLGGDGLYGGEPSLAGLVREGRVDEMQEQARIIGRLLFKSPATYEKAAWEQSAIDLPTAFAMLADTCRDPTYLPSFHTDWISSPVDNLRWLTPEMGRLVAERAEALGDQMSGTTMSADAFNTIISMRSSGQSHRHSRYLSDLFHAPFVDHAVLRAAAQLELRKRSPFRTFKPLLEAALAGRGVPRKVFERTTKGNYAGIVYEGQRRAIPKILDLLNNSRLADMGIIDPRAVRESIEAFGLDRKRYRLAHFVSAELWLRRHDLALTNSASELGTATIAEDLLTPEMMDTLSGHYHVTTDIRFAAGPDGAVALNTRTGHYGSLNTAAVRILRLINTYGSAQVVAQKIAKLYPAIAPDKVYSDVARVIEDIKSMGIISESSGESHVPVDLPEQPVTSPVINAAAEQLPSLEPTEQYCFSEAEISAGRQVLDQASDFTEQGLAATIEFLQSLWGEAGSTSDSESCRRDKVLIQRLAMDGLYSKQRIACYESSLAVAILAARRRQRVRFSIGVAFRPGPMLHAWIEVNGEPVTISTDISLEGYQKLLQV